MMSAASAVASMSSSDGSAGTNSGAIRHRFAQRMRVSAADVRELVSSARRCTCPIGTRVKMATDRMGPSEPIATPGTRR